MSLFSYILAMCDLFMSPFSTNSVASTFGGDPSGIGWD
jgi:hypothetical protein